MGHFEKGRWIETPFDKLQETADAFSIQLGKAFSNMAELLQEWDRHSGEYQDGAELTRVQVMERGFRNVHTALVRDGLLK